MKSEVYNMDCIEGMKQYPDKYFELAIVDPPYGINESNKKRKNTQSKKWKNANKKIIYQKKNWDNDIPTEEYFIQLKRISKNQIIWGGNYMIDYLYPTSGWIFWDKKNGQSDFSDGELAWTSFNMGLRKFEWLWNGFQKQKPEKRFHPTQKPVALYKWILNKYAKEKDKILDTHLGSGSSRIAAYDMGFDFVGYELDKDYFDAQEKRFNEFKMQGKLF
jgi:site-specific DNA-methyltransferase (adenine-specific)